MGAPERRKPSLQVLVTHADGRVETFQGPQYRRTLLAALTGMRRQGKPMPITEDEVRRQPLSILVAADNAWAETNAPGYVAALVTVSEGDEQP